MLIFVEMEITAAQLVADGYKLPDPIVNFLLVG